MKKAVFLSIFVFNFQFCFSQEHTITIYAALGTAGQIDYLHAQMLLPDSLTNTLLIDYRKKYKLKFRNAGEAVLYRMNVDGWKVMSINFHDSYPYIYLKKEIILNTTAYDLYIEKLNAFDL